MFERKRIQFSLWNLMLMVVLWAVLFWYARMQQERAGWTVWFGVACLGALPAVGALLGGWPGMKKGLGRILVLTVLSIVMVLIAFAVGLLLQLVIGR